MTTTITSWNINGLKSVISSYGGNLNNILSHLESDIICFQETKLLMGTLRSEVSISDDYYSYFAVCNCQNNQLEKAYSGTATFVRKGIPTLKAQVGLTGRQNVNKKYNNNERRDDNIIEILPNEVILTEDELYLLDLEGRCVITDHGEFVLFNIYAPNAHPTSTISASCSPDNSTPEWNVSIDTDINDLSDRFVFKMKFNYLLAYCVNKIQSQGRNVIVVGDLNVTSTRLDHCEPENHDYCEPFEITSSTPFVMSSSHHETRINDVSKSGNYWRYTFESRPQVLWMKNILSVNPCYIVNKKQEGNKLFHPNPLLSLYNDYLYIPCGMVDTFRFKWPQRENAFTCWNTLTGARQTNFGTRLDYILVSCSLLDHVISVDIDPAVEGSDHCPVKCAIATPNMIKDNTLIPPDLCSIHRHSSVQTSLTTFLAIKKEIATDDAATYSTSSNICGEICQNNDSSQVTRISTNVPKTTSRNSSRSKMKTNPISVAMMKKLVL